jgi:hypothetical protein
LMINGRRVLSAASKVAKKIEFVDAKCIYTFADKSVLIVGV